MDSTVASKIDRPARLAALALAVGLLAYLCLVLPRDTARAAPIWLANAVVLAVLLKSPPRTWWMWIAAGFAGNVSADIAAGDTLARSLALSLCNAGEALACGVFLRRKAPEGFDPARSAHLALIRNAAILAAAVAAVAATAVIGLTGARDYLPTLLTWAAADALGLMIVTPCLLALLDARRSTGRTTLTRGAVLGLAAVLAINLIVFGQDRYSLMFIAVGAGLVASVTLETLGAALAVLITTCVAVGFTFTGSGPIALQPGSWSERLIVLQLFLAVTSGLNLHVAAMTRRRRNASEELEAARRAAEDQAARAVEAEARYRLMAEHATDIISRASISGEMIYHSAAVERVTGYRPEELRGQKLAPRVHPDDRDDFIKGHLDLISGRRQPGAPLRYRVIHKDGRWIWLEGNPSVVHDENGMAVEFVDVSRDVGERVELEARLEAVRAEAEQAARVKSEFLANMSHEIRTPLTSILGFASLLAEKPLGEEADRYVRRVLSASRSLLAIVNDVLDFSKLEAGRLELRPRPTDPAECAREVLELFTAQAEAKGIRLSFEADRDAGPVLADPDRLRQILMNLVGNAVKFTTRGSVRVVLSHQTRARRLRFEIRDTGPGLVRGARAKLFQRFSQVDASTTRAHGGTGLGLAICKGLVEAMGGRIGVTSRVGRGACFWFEVAAEPALTVRLAASADVDAAVLAGLRVLVADDNPANRELVRSLLGALGVNVVGAAGGAEAVEAAGGAPFDVILMDLRMPGVDGWAAAQAIRAGDGPNRNVPILAFSADVSADRQHLSEVFQGVVAKPVEPAELLRALASADPQHGGDLAHAVGV
jgi:PAS domain S-box-containing protein